MDRDISLDAIKLVACIFVCTLHTIGMFMSESPGFHLSYLCRVKYYKSFKICTRWICLNIVPSADPLISK